MTTWPKRDKDGRHITSVEVEVDCKECVGYGFYYSAGPYIGDSYQYVCSECKGTGKVKCQ